MATKLEKDITRESSIKIDGKEVMVTLTADQGITFKLKGMRSGAVSIPIEKLYNQLSGRATNEPKKELTIRDNAKVSKKNPMINLYELRSHNAISTLDLSSKAKFDQVIKSLIEEVKYDSKRKG